MNLTNIAILNIKGSEDIKLMQNTDLTEKVEDYKRKFKATLKQI